MKIGFLTGYSEEIVEWARWAGFQSLELQAGPGSPLDATKMTGKQFDSVMQCLTDSGIECSALAWYTNHLDPDSKKRAATAAYFGKLIDLAAKMKVGTVCTFAGGDPNRSIPDNIPDYKKVFARHAKRAEAKGIKIAFENWPSFNGWPFRAINIGYTPAAYDLMFEAVPSEAIGLEYDPSHFYWQHIDYIEVIRNYGPRIYHVHAKDTEIMYDRFGVQGIYGRGWWRYRVPGWGEVDWQRTIGALHDVGYTGNLDIEQEDPVFSRERFNEGLVLGLKHLSQFVS